MIDATNTTGLKKLTEETTLLNYSHPAIKELVERMGWRHLDIHGKILTIYNYIRDDILFGFNEKDTIPASRVLSDGYGQCNTKSTLFMTLLRAVGIPCRIHGFTINKELQKGALTGIWYAIAPNELLHTWVEVYYRGKWIDMEGFILDKPYLKAVTEKFAPQSGGFCGYGIATDTISCPQVEWKGENTYIQKEGIEQDFGVFDSPDELYAEHSQPVGPLRWLLFQLVVRKNMNANIVKYRLG